MPETLLDAHDVTKRFTLRSGFALGRAPRVLTAVDRVTVSLSAGETLGLVGESGCGKTTLGRLLIRLIEPTAGDIRFAGTPLHTASGEALRALRRHIQIIFQDPTSSLNPRLTVGDTLEEPLTIHRLGDGTQRQRRVTELLDAVGLPAEYRHRLPRHLSGGERQRVGIARALATQPRVIICDEPIASLDLSIGAQILSLLLSLQRRFGLSYLFISHDLRAVALMSHRIAVMHLGQLVELAETDALLSRPLHPYTELLLNSATSTTIPASPVTGELPSPLAPPSGCRFRTRCPIAQSRCADEEPPLLEKTPGRLVACHFRP